MTNKTTAAMFAIAMIAVMGLVNPSFAVDDQITYNTITNPPSGTTQTSATDNDSCGASGTCSTYLKVYNDNPTDKARVYYDVTGQDCDINVVIKVNGNTVLNWNRADYIGTGEYVGTVSTAIDNNDQIDSVTTFTDC